MTDLERSAVPGDPAGDDLRNAVQYFVDHHARVHGALMWLRIEHLNVQLASVIHQVSWWLMQALAELLLTPDDGGNLCLELSLLKVADAAPQIATNVQSAPLQALQRLQTAVALAQETIMETSPMK